MPLYSPILEVQQCEPESTFVNDFSKLISFVQRYNNTFPEYIRVARMYLFGTPIRRTGTHLRHPTPGCIRLRLYSSDQPKGDDSAALIDDEIDFPLEPNGDLDFHRVKQWWGIQVCTPLLPYSWDLFTKNDTKNIDKISGIAVHNLTAGYQRKMSLLFLSDETNEYRREEQGTWTHQLKWQRRALIDDPAWYINRLIALCALFWLLSLIPGALSLLSSITALVLAPSARCAREFIGVLLASLMRCAHDFVIAVSSETRARTFVRIPI
ncbi:hypothetical protein BGW80DRAFT_916112 [Lactifluus volemus]|nr:hypothetical protein BGW80DRAFT_916112 [Lactifluus volemus]